MAKASNQSSRIRSAKGNETRRRILEAVLIIIAREGTRGVTHRSVAAEADVQTSLTTYYFEDIDSLIREAFDYFSQHSRPDIESLWDEIFRYLDGFSAGDLRTVATRQAICDELSHRATEYIVEQILRKPVGLAVEQVFFTHTRLSADMRHMGMIHRQQLLQPLVRLCERFNRDDPQIDAELLLNAITSLEYQALAASPKDIDRAHIEQLVRRQVGWLLGLKRA